MQRSSDQSDDLARLPRPQSCQGSRRRPPAPRHRHRAASRSADRMESAIRGTWTQSGIAAAPVPKPRITAALKSEFWVQCGPNFTLDHCRRERNFWMQRHGTKNRHSNARTPVQTKIREMSAGNPRRNALFGVVPETFGLRRARTWDPMIPMIIRSINGIFANRSDKAPLIRLRYCRQCKPDTGLPASSYFNGLAGSGSQIAFAWHRGLSRRFLE
jgi:hypothetical protein